MVPSTLAHDDVEGRVASMEALHPWTLSPYAPNSLTASGQCSS